MNERENAFDFFRCVCTLAVVLLHVSALSVNKMLTGDMELAWGPNILNCIPRFAVPCFVMLSGAFLLDDERNGEYAYFYKKSIKTLGIPTLVFSIVYFIYAEISLILSASEKISWTSYIKPVVDVVKGAPYYHMWYLYMLIGLYFAVPIIIRAKREVNFKCLEKVAWGLLVLCMCSYITSTHRLKWDIGFSMCFVGYFLLGYVIRKKYMVEKSKVRCIVCIGVGMFTNILISILRMQELQKGNTGDEFVGEYAPLVVVMSVSLFIGIANLKMKCNSLKVARNTFYVYLLHALVLELVASVFTVTKEISIILITILVFALSYLGAIVCGCIGQKSNHRNRFSLK